MEFLGLMLVFYIISAMNPPPADAVPTGPAGDPCCAYGTPQYYERARMEQTIRSAIKAGKK